MDSEELLAQLADIHLPDPVGFWPPAPGWWILAALLLTAAVLLSRHWRRIYQRRQICHHAVAELERCLTRHAEADGDESKARLAYINAVNAVLRRVALVHYPRSNVAGLDGRAWVEFMRKNGNSGKLDEELATALAYGRFQTRCDVNVDALQAFARDWITSQYLGTEGSRRTAEPQGIRT